MTPRVMELAATAADDADLIAQIADIVNAAYAHGEAGLWRPGWKRTTPAQIRQLVAEGGMLVATAGERIVGCAHVRDIDATTADLGLVSAAPDEWGGGTGRALVRAAEGLACARGTRAMQLELLVPRGATHPEKERLRAWSERRG
jgi:GNAT superfamily N-acetyltransferase